MFSTEPFSIFFISKFSLNSEFLSDNSKELKKREKIRDGITLTNFVCAYFPHGENRYTDQLSASSAVLELPVRKK